MVRVYGANLTDITDRPPRAIGTIYGNWLAALGDKMPLNMTENLSIPVQQRPWWVYHAPGRDMHIDDFEGTLGWLQATGTVTKASEATHVHTGNSALKLVTGAVAGNPASAMWFGPECITYIHEQYLIVSFWWQLQAAVDSTPRDIYFKLYVASPTKGKEYTFGMRYQHNTGGVPTPAWMAYHTGGVWFPIVTPKRKIVIFPMWNFWQMAITWPTLGTDPSYRWFWMNSTTAVKSVQVPYQAASTEAYSQIEVGCTTDAAVATTAYIDDFLYMDECGWTDF